MQFYSVCHRSESNRARTVLSVKVELKTAQFDKANFYLVENATFLCS